MSNKSSAPDERPVPKSTVFRIFKSDSFIEHFLLLIITAILSGVIIPQIITRADAIRLQREARSQAQEKLLDDISETIFSCETLILDVTWFGTDLAKNPEMQKKAFDRYMERSVDLIAKWRAQTSRARVLASPKVSDKLTAFQLRFFNEQDTPMNRQWKTCSTNCDWNQLHKKNVDMLSESNVLIGDLARDFGLARQ
jgi:hypothetical protein